MANLKSFNLTLPNAYSNQSNSHPSPKKNEKEVQMYSWQNQQSVLTTTNSFKPIQSPVLLYAGNRQSSWFVGRMIKNGEGSKSPLFPSPSFSNSNIKTKGLNTY